ncbi:MAG: TIGR02597 family protein [Opitutales bacterium]
MHKILKPFLFGLALAPFAVAQDAAYSETWGVTTLEFPANSDTYLSLIFPRDEAFRGVVDSVDTSGSDPVITFSGSPFSNGEFISGDDVFYLLVCSGPLDGSGNPTAASEEGAFATVIGNGTGNVVLSGPEADGAFSDLNNIVGETVKIIPYWTLETLFPDGEGIAAITTTEEIGSKSEILFPALPNVDDPSTVGSAETGTNLPAATRVVLADLGGEKRWVETVDGFPGFENEPLSPNSFLIVRNQTDSELSVSHYGPVNTAAIRIPVGTVAANRAQDNPVGFVVPVELTISDLNLETVVDGATSLDSFDEVLVYKSGTGVNRPADSRLLLANGSWFLTSNPTPGNEVNDFMVDPGDALVIRKAAGPVRVSEWILLPEALRNLSNR